MFRAGVNKKPLVWHFNAWQFKNLTGLDRWFENVKTEMFLHKLLPFNELLKLLNVLVSCVPHEFVSG